jgi:hypothetical protein
MNRALLMRKRKTFNSKRRMLEECNPHDLEDWVQNVRYGGNPEHKKNPGDFGLQPPAEPRSDKTLCDEVGIFDRKLATGLLKEGIQRGLVAVQMRAKFPQNVWAVTQNGQPLEAQLENPAQGIYHLKVARKSQIVDKYVYNQYVAEDIRWKYLKIQNALVVMSVIT